MLNALLILLAIAAAALGGAISLAVALVEAEHRRRSGGPR